MNALKGSTMLDGDMSSKLTRLEGEIRGLKSSQIANDSMIDDFARKNRDQELMNQHLQERLKIQAGFIDKLEDRLVEAFEQIASLREKTHA